jgi:hypothetical protein
MVREASQSRRGGGRGGGKMTRALGGGKEEGWDGDGSARVG